MLAIALVIITDFTGQASALETDDIFFLDPSAPPSVLVNTVGSLCNLLNEEVTWQVEQLLGTQDIERYANLHSWQ